MSSSYKVFYHDTDKQGVGVVRVKKVTNVRVDPNTRSLILEGANGVRAVFAADHWTQVREDTKVSQKCTSF